MRQRFETESPFLASVPRSRRPSLSCGTIGRGGRIRTGGLGVPNAARCQAAPRPAETIVEATTVARRSMPVNYWRRGCSSMVEPQPSKLVMRVRFPSPAQIPRRETGGRARSLHPRGLRNGSFSPLQSVVAPVAQGIERLPSKQRVGGSNPSRRTGCQGLCSILREILAGEHQIVEEVPVRDVVFILGHHRVQVRPNHERSFRTDTSTGEFVSQLYPPAPGTPDGCGRVAGATHSPFVESCCRG